jgi:glucose/arabinose dehydrogenase
VLGLAAVAASVSRQPQESDKPAKPPAAQTEAPKTPMAEALPESAAPSENKVEVVFKAGRDQTRRLDAGQAATVLVESKAPGLVEIPDLGLTGAAEPLTPAQFDVLVDRGGRYGIAFTPASGDTASKAGTLVVRAAEG